MKRYVILSALLLPVMAGAQNINPTVQVTNTYEGHLVDIQKISTSMAVPDSVMRFDWNFDYSVFENPYKGAYEFSPYLISFRPEERLSGGQSFYLRAGAGYGLHPELTAVWSPKLRKSPLRLTLYDDFKGYFGNYHIFKADARDGVLSPARDTCSSGYDFQNRLGASAHYVNSDVDLLLDMGYNLLGVGGMKLAPRGQYPELMGGTLNSWLDGFDVAVRAKSMSEGPLGVEGALSFRNSSQSVPRLATLDQLENMSFKDMNVLASVTGAYRYGEFDCSLGLAAEYGKVPVGDVDSYFSFRAKPGVEWRRDRLHAAASLELNVRSGALTAAQLLYPALKLDYKIVPELLDIYGGYKSGRRISAMMDIARDYRFYPEYVSGLVDEESEIMNVFLGAGGRLGSRFQYSLTGGYCRYGNSLLDGFAPQYLMSGTAYPYVMSEGLKPLLQRVDYDAFYAEASLDWKSERLSSHATVKYQYCSAESLCQNGGGFLLPAALSAQALFTYNWNRRIFAGLSVEGQTARSFTQDGLSAFYQSLRLPGWVDLGLNAEFKATRRLSLWAKGGNLLGQTIHRNILFAEKGAYFTLGIGLDF